MALEPLRWIEPLAVISSAAVTSSDAESVALPMWRWLLLVSVSVPDIEDRFALAAVCVNAQVTGVVEGGGDRIRSRRLEGEVRQLVMEFTVPIEAEAIALLPTSIKLAPLLT